VTESLLQRMSRNFNTF